MNIGIIYYLAQILENVGTAFMVIGVIGTFLSLFALAFYWFEIRTNSYNDNERPTWRKALKVALPVSLTCLFLAIFCPSKKAVLAMYIVPKIENNQKVMQITDKALDRILDILEVETKKENNY